VNPDKPRDVHVDWDAFEASPGRKQAMQTAKIEAQHRLLGEQYAQCAGRGNRS
jgi:hypothetical protein